MRALTVVPGTPGTAGVTELPEGRDRLVLGHESPGRVLQAPDVKVVLTLGG